MSYSCPLPYQDDRYDGDNDGNYSDNCNYADEKWPGEDKCRSAGYWRVLPWRAVHCDCWRHPGTGARNTPTSSVAHHIGATEQHNTPTRSKATHSESFTFARCHWGWWVMFALFLVPPKKLLRLHWHKSPWDHRWWESRPYPWLVIWVVAEARRCITFQGGERRRWYYAGKADESQACLICLMTTTDDQNWEDMTYDSSSCYQEGPGHFKEEKQTSPSQVCFSSWQGIFQPLVIVRY